MSGQRNIRLILEDASSTLVTGNKELTAYAMAAAWRTA